MVKDLASAIAIILTVVIFVPYGRAALAGRIAPHAFSWLIWTLVTLSVFCAQLSDGAGVGAWPVGLSGAITASIAVLAWLGRGDVAPTRSDAYFLVAAASALPIWWATSDPVWAVLILTAIDLAGFGPTVRLAWRRPHHEQARFFALAAIRNALVVTALEHYSVATVLFPAAVGLGCLALVSLLLLRRRAVPAQ